MHTPVPWHIAGISRPLPGSRVQSEEQRKAGCSVILSVDRICARAKLLFHTCLSRPGRNILEFFGEKALDVRRQSVHGSLEMQAVPVPVPVRLPPSCYTRITIVPPILPDSTPITIRMHIQSVRA